MNTPLGPCPDCGRHVVASAKDCPFCGRRLVLKAGAAAAVSLLVPDAARGQDAPEQDYGVPREISPAETAAIDRLWTGTLATWRASLGLAKPYAAWNALGKGASATYECVDAKQPRERLVSITFQHIGGDERGLKLRASAPARALETPFILQPDGAVPDDARVVAQSKEEIHVGERTFASDVKSYEWVGNELKVWWCQDAPGGFVKAQRGKDTVRLTAVEEKVEAAGRAWTCSVWEIAGPDGTAREWRCDEAPGGVVKWEFEKDGKVVRSAALARILKP